MIVDVWDGLGVYASDDAEHWDRQSSNLLRSPGEGEDDGVKGQHADVVVSGERAFLFHFTHPGRGGRAVTKKDSSDFRRGSIQATELIFQAGDLTCNRDAPMRIRLLPPRNPRPRSHDVRWRVQRLELTAQPHRGTVRDGLLSHLRRVCS